jgi:uncharacterized delta-60 repeat protein
VAVFFSGALLSLFATANSQALIRERARQVDAGARRTGGAPVAPYGGVEQAWVGRYNGPANGGDSAVAMAIDGSGNVYVTGGSDSDITPDFITIKYDSTGQQQWVARFSGEDNTAEFANAIAIDSSGNVYVTGVGWGYGNDSDYGTIKYNSSGEQQWVGRYDGPAHSLDTAMAIAVDSSGNVYVTGWSPGLGTGYDYATIKYSASGQEEWVARYNGPGNSDDAARAIAVDEAGNVYVTGQSFGAGTDFDYATIKYSPDGQEQSIARYNGPGNGTDQAYGLAVDGSSNVYVTGGSLSSGGDLDCATIKYNSSGQEQWVARYNAPANGADAAFAMAIDSAGYVYVTGESVGSGTGYDYATIKYSASGQQQWAARYNGPANDRDGATAIAVDGLGNVYVTGYSTGLGTDYDYATVKYSPAGEENWVARYNGPGNFVDVAYGIAVDGLGNVYVAGTSVGLGTNTDYATIKHMQGVAASPTPTPTGTPNPTPTPTATLTPTPSGTPTPSPTIITVTNTNDSGPGSLRQALADANDNATIDFAVTGTIGLTSGELLVDQSITISGPGAENLTIDGNAKSRVFHIAPSETVTISGLTITNGYTTGFGGGFHNDHAALTLNSCTITGNASSSNKGGGIYNDAEYPDSALYATLEVNNSSITDNSGGGIYNSAEGGGVATLDITDSILSNNSSGNAIYSHGFSCQFCGHGTATVQITNSSIKDNPGGAIYSDTGQPGTTVSITNSTVSGNAGAAVYNSALSATVISNSTISRNSGGGIYSDFNAGASGSSVFNSTMSHNYVEIWNTGFNGFNGSYIKNTIFNVSPGGHSILGGPGPLVSYGYNLSSDDGGGYLTGPGDQINTEPMLGPLQDNGGPTFTYQLLPGSPAINAGDPTFIPPPDFDQRGPGFNRVRNGRIDIGSFEVQAEPRPIPTPRSRPSPPPRPKPR